MDLNLNIFFGIAKDALVVNFFVLLGSINWNIIWKFFLSLSIES